MLKKIWDVIMKISDTMSEDNITVYSAQTSFFIVISAIPFIMLLCMLAGNFIKVSDADIIRFLDSSVPKSVAPMLEFILQEILEKKMASSISISALTLLWTASRSVVAVEKGLDSVYHSTKQRGVIALNAYALFYTFAFLVVILFSLLIMVFGNSIAQMMTDVFPVAEGVVNSILSARAFISFVILTLFFAFAYKFIPGRKLKLQRQLPGAVFSASGWMIFSLLFSIYIDNFSNKSYVYGSLTALIILMLWLYFCMIIMFVGGEINNFLENAASEKDKTLD
jgi:membrane protein